MDITWNGTPIRTDFVYPPIPIRSSDWCATLGDFDEGSLLAWGESEQAAVAALIEELWARV